MIDFIINELLLLEIHIVIYLKMLNEVATWLSISIHILYQMLYLVHYSFSTFFFFYLDVHLSC